MKRKQMIEFLKLGFKITHETFTPDEFIHMYKGSIHDENGYDHGYFADEFMQIRKGGFWEDGWSLHAPVLRGKDISSVRPYYENIVFYKDGIGYFIEQDDLLELVKSSDYMMEVKKTRVWIKPLPKK